MFQRRAQGRVRPWARHLAAAPVDPSLIAGAGARLARNTLKLWLRISAEER
jgi:hypothetical protein